MRENMTLYEKMERYSELRARISDIERKIDDRNRLIRNLEDNGTGISYSCDGWEATKDAYDVPLLTPVIFYTSEFEGDIAEEFNDTIPTIISDLQGNCNEMLRVKGAIGDQISLLQRNISVLYEEIENIQNEINSLGL